MVLATWKVKNHRYVNVTSFSDTQFDTYWDVANIEYHYM